MRKSSKVISLLLAGLMAISSFGMQFFSTLAATIDIQSTGVMTEQQRLAAGHELVYFKWPTSAWGPLTGVKWSSKKHTVNVYCNIYAICGNKKTVKNRAWEAPSTSMMADKAGRDIFYFDITDGNQIAERDATDDHKMEPGAAYGILFSSKANNESGDQTCDLYFDTNCIGDTFIVDEPPTFRENTQDSKKKDYYAHSLNGIAQPIRKISTLCAYIDGMGKELDGKTQINGKTLNYVPDSLEGANRLKDYLPNPTNEPSFSKAKFGTMMEKFETNAVDVYWMYDERFGEYYNNSEAVQYTHVDGVEDLNPDGTLQDAYRYRTYIKDKGVENYEETMRLPDYELVAERVGLDTTKPIPKQIKDVDLTLNRGDVTVPNDANYTVSKETVGENLVITVAPKNDGYAFTAKPTITKTGFDEDNTTIAYDNGKNYISEVDGKIIVTTAKPDATDEPIASVSLGINNDDLAPGKELPALSDGDNYTVATAWEPNDATFAYNTEYTLTATYTANQGYCFDANTGVDTDLEGVSKEIKDGQLIAKYTFKTGNEPIAQVKLGINSDDLAGGKLAPKVTVPDGAKYEVTTTWGKELVNGAFAYNTEYTLTATYTANEGYCFIDGTEVTDTNLNNLQKSINEDGQLVVKYDFTTGNEPIAQVDLDINSDDLAGGKLAPNVTVPDDAKYEVTTTWGKELVNGAFAYNTEYTLTATYTANQGYCFDANTGVDTDLEGVSKEIKDGQLIAKYTFKTGNEPIAQVDLDINSDDLAPGKEPPALSDGDNYTVATTWEPNDAAFAYNTEYTLTATYTANEGYCFDANTGVDTDLEDVSKEIKDGQLIAKYTFTTGNEPIAQVSLDINSDDLAPGKELPALSDGDNYTVATAWEPNDAAFAYGTEYTLTATYTANEGYCFDANTGVDTDLEGVSKEIKDGQLIAKYTFETDKLIDSVELNINTDELVGGNLAPKFNAPEGANYTVKTDWGNDLVNGAFAYDTTYTLKVTYTANEGYCFNDDTKVLPETEGVSKEIEDGKLIATYTSFTTGPKPIGVIESVNFVTGDALAPGEAISAVTIPDGDNYKVTDISWGDSTDTDSTFAYKTDYTLTVIYTANEDFIFDATTDVADKPGIKDEDIEITVSDDGKQLTVKYSFIYPVYIVAGDQADIFGTAWDSGNEDNKMTKNDDGTYTKEYTVDKAYDVIQLKVVKVTSDVVWIGDENGDNVAFALTGPGTFTVKFDPETATIEILGDIVAEPEFNYETVYAAGNGEGNWLNGIAWETANAANEMTKVEDHVWEITFKYVPAGFDRQIKFALDGAWTYNFGASKAEDAPAFEPGVEMEAGWDGGNITFDTEDLCHVTVRLDLRDFDFITKQGAKYTITIEPALGDVNGDGVVDICDATFIQRYLAELEDFNDDQLAAADFDGDGIVTICDVTMIQRYLVNLF